MTANADPDDPLLDALNRIADDADAGPSKVDQANLRHAPRLLDLTQLTVKVHYNTDQATITARLSDDPDSITSIGDTAAQHKCAGGAECASCECPR
ncbi:Hypothetical protein AJAP_12040 [Amycolatopsis japonica]|uniref:Uncharacterized protein n=1 Tax=Amycolatopsis japonica TaxID=208439 RepID=A0A075US81_9PSEU|nr:hypothetical protein [Amycolatopsis japonica]AIG75291.1 Hypothetical protein AJAP_12040 [Amycolatopsis japonica]